MRDGIRLAVSKWYKYEVHDCRELPVVLLTTRYWRAMGFKKKNLESQFYFTLAETLCHAGYILVVADARGTGASFGCRKSEGSHEEVLDIGEIINWLADQSWCNGSVTVTGTSYSAGTALLSLVTAPKPLELIVCRAPDFDVYRHLLAPGGVVNYWFVNAWGEATAAQDGNDVSALYDGGYWPMPEDGCDVLLGVMEVDDSSNMEYCADGSLLAGALDDHAENYNLASSSEALNFADGDFFTGSYSLFDRIYKQAIEKSAVPVVIRCGWHDAGTALGALCMYATFDIALKVILGPWNHEGSYHVDPMDCGDGNEVGPFNIGKARALTLQSIGEFFNENKSGSVNLTAPSSFRAVEYYTLGEGVWKSTNQWPLPHALMHRWYLSEDNALSTCKPVKDLGCDSYVVDTTATTGKQNRWYAQASGQPILFPDRREEDRKLLVYDMPPLEWPTEITGHPLVTLWLSSTATDGQFFVYLETIDPDGRVRLLTEGQLRGIHHKVSSTPPPYTMFGPYRSFKQCDARPLVVGQITELSFELFPISILLPAGQRLRIAIAGADADVFAPIDGCESPMLTVERNRIYASYIDLPIIPQQE